ncbi:MAG: carbohydrate ABC transporter permease [Nocardioides sp.]
MTLKLVNTILTVAAGIGVALALYWVLNKLAELLPDKLEHRVKPYLYILPAYVAIVVYLVFPTILTVVNSFKDRFSENWVGFDNYTNLLSNQGFRDTLFNTLLWIAIVPAATVVLGLAIAVLADRLGSRGEKLTKTIIFLPMAISMIGAATIWNLVYETRPEGTAQIGLQNAIVEALGFSPIAWLEQSQFHLNSLFLMVVLLWSQAGYSMVLLSAAVKGVPSDTLEAARIDGANERQIFFKVVVPQIKGTIVTVFVTVLIFVMKIFDIVYVMTNGGFNTNVVGNEFWNQLSTSFNYGTSSAIVVMLMIAIIPIMVYQVRNFKEQEANA